MSTAETLARVLGGGVTGWLVGYSVASLLASGESHPYWLAVCGVAPLVGLAFSLTALPTSIYLLASLAATLSFSHGYVVGYESGGNTEQRTELGFMILVALGMVASVIGWVGIRLFQAVVRTVK